MSYFEFAPRFDIAALHGGDVLVTFDSASPDDRKRAPRSVRISEFKQLSIALDGFEQLEEIESGNGRIFAGAVKLNVTRLQGQDDVVALADIEFRVAPLPTQGRKQAAQFPDAADLRDAIRASVADVSGEALARLGAVLESRASVGAPMAPVALASEPVANVVPLRPRVRPQERSSSRPATDRRERRLLLSIVAGGPLAVILLWGLGKVFSGPAVPPMPVAAQINAYDPAATEAQVELTKQTLREMGLDPGDSAADLGCLVQPQQQ